MSALFFAVAIHFFIRLNDGAGSDINCLTVNTCYAMQLDCSGPSYCYFRCQAQSACNTAQMNCFVGVSCNVDCREYEACRSATINAADASSLSLTTGPESSGNPGTPRYQVYYANIICPTDGPCTVSCTHTEWNCQAATIHAELSTSLTLICYGPAYACGNMVIYCPNVGTCNLDATNDDTSAFIGVDIYSVNGFNTLTISGDVHVVNDPVLGTMYCSSDYSFSCGIAKENANQCDTAAPDKTCNNPPAPTTPVTDTPTRKPTLFPSINPTPIPTIFPTQSPSESPISSPTVLPTTDPSSHPVAAPSDNPTPRPTKRPTGNPTLTPSYTPTVTPSNNPTSSPILTLNPSASPTTNPSNNPTSIPTSSPANNPTINPSNTPSSQPSLTPTSFPSSIPTSSPESNPTITPSNTPTSAPLFVSSTPTSNPSNNPTSIPSNNPISQITDHPTITPSNTPTSAPLTVSLSPSLILTSNPSNNPTSIPSNTDQPTASGETGNPSLSPTSIPTLSPINNPTITPSINPTLNPLSVSSSSPSSTVTINPTSIPTSPIYIATNTATSTPSNNPISSSSPGSPSSSPSSAPIRSSPVTDPPTVSGETTNPSLSPTLNPSNSPISVDLSTTASLSPSGNPTKTPTLQPSSTSTMDPTHSPSLPIHPTETPTSIPTISPSFVPTTAPSGSDCDSNDALEMQGCEETDNAPKDECSLVIEVDFSVCYIDCYNAKRGNLWNDIKVCLCKDVFKDTDFDDNKSKRCYIEYYNYAHLVNGEYVNNGATNCTLQQTFQFSTAMYSEDCDYLRDIGDWLLNSYDDVIQALDDCSLLYSKEQNNNHPQGFGAIVTANVNIDLRDDKGNIVKISKAWHHKRAPLIAILCIIFMMTFIN